MKVRDYLDWFHTKRETALTQQQRRNKRALEQLHQNLEKQRSAHLTQQTQFKAALEKARLAGKIQQDYFDEQLAQLEDQAKAFQQNAKSLVEKQEALNRKNTRRLSESINQSILTEIFNHLVKDCVGNTNLIEKSFQGIPAHVQKFNLKWQLIAKKLNASFGEEEPADPDRFYKFVESEKTGIMLWQWKRWEQLRRCKRYIRSQAKAGDKQAQTLIKELNNGYTRLR